MKPNLLFILFLLIIQTSFSQNSLNLNKEWKFSKGDNLAYADSTFDDSKWASIKVDKIWEEQGYDPYDGYAWFRYTVKIPSTLISKAYLKDSLRIYLGKINNYDMSFLNGILFGINGVTVTPDRVTDVDWIHAPMQYYDKIRPYTLGINDPRIKWDKENVFAVRVYDQGGQGGMYTGDQYVRMTKLTDYLDLENNANPYVFEGGNVKKSVSIRNTSAKYTLAGVFTIRAINKVTKEELYEHQENVTLDPAQSQDFSIILKQLNQSALVMYDFTMNGSGDKLVVTDETPYITTPKETDKPKINGASITAARPNHPFMFTIPCSGLRPISFTVKGLPTGLSVNSQTGIISGKVTKTGDYRIKVKVQNSFGSDTKEIILSIGDRICLTPPMGWNSWNCWGLAVDEQKVIASAKTFKSKGLMNHGWTYINIDDGWEIFKDQEPKRDPFGAILTNEKFPDMKRLGDSIHALGLKFGIYSSPGPLTCGQYTASYLHELQDAKSYASWGVDYLKYDWCSYEKIAKDTSLEERMKPYFVMRSALDSVDRDIVYSLCQYGMSKVWEWGDQVGGNLWRTTGDITDTWESLKEIGFSQVANAKFAKPGNWNDPDMLIVGWVGWGPSLHPTRLTPDEQYTHISLWSLLSAPLLIGCDLERLDPFTLNLLTNDEVLAIDQDPLGKQATPILTQGDVQIWIKELADGTKAMGIFNLGEKTAEYTLKATEINLSPDLKVRDLWRQKDLGKLNEKLDVKVPSHGVLLFKVAK